MTYLELINRFWDLHQVKCFSSMECAVYFYMLNECNIRRWLNPFELRTRNLELEFMITRKTIGEVRNKLKQRGLIDYIEGRCRKPSVYLIKDAAYTNKEIKKTAFSVSVSSKKQVANVSCNVVESKHYGNIRGNTMETLEETLDGFSPYLDIKTKTKDKDKKNTNAQAREFFEEVEVRHSPIPTLDEVKQHFRSLRANERVTDWEECAEKFFYHYDGLGWRNSNGAIIANWKSTASLWLYDAENRDRKEQQKQQSYGKNRQISENRRVEFETSARSAEDYEGSF